MFRIVAHRAPQRRVRLMVLLLLLVGGITPTPSARAAGPIIYVKATATGGADGSSWANAYPQLTSALASASSGDQIWVAAGTYRPTSGSDRAATFALKNGVAIYGGFGGTETLLSQRDWTTNVVTLSGDLLDNDVGFSNNGENSYHVVTGATGATLDGLAITGGNANSVNTYPDNCGGGVINNNFNSPTLRNLMISGNAATYSGGGIFNLHSGANLTNVTISGNVADSGGGIANEMSSPVLTNVTISGNTAESLGGGLFTNNGGRCEPPARTAQSSAHGPDQWIYAG